MTSCSPSRKKEVDSAGSLLVWLQVQLGSARAIVSTCPHTIFHIRIVTTAGTVIQACRPVPRWPYYIMDVHRGRSGPISRCTRRRVVGYDGTSSLLSGMDDGAKASTTCQICKLCLTIRALAVDS